MQDPNKPGEDEFFDDEFDQFEDFDDTASEQGGDQPYGAYDEPAQDDQSYAAPGDDMDMGDDFSQDDWDQDYADQSGEEKGRGSLSSGGGLKNLSFNTMAIIGAVLVGGGVLAFQLLTAPAPGGDASRFQSALNFTGSTDGVVLGEGTSEQAVPAEQPATPDITPMPEEGAANDQGFLNNPGVLDGLSQEAADAGAPPMPAPISNELDDQGAAQHTDAAAPTPGSLDLSFDEAQPVPRGPDEIAAEQTPPADTGDVPAEPAPLIDDPIAEAPESSPALDVIRQAQNQRNQETAAPVEGPVPVVDEMPAPVSTPKEPEVVEPAPEPEPAPAPEPEPVAEEPVAEPAVDVAAVAAAEKKAADAKLAAMADRLSVLEQQLVQLRESGSSNIGAAEKDMAQMRADLDDAGAPLKPAPKATPTKPAKKQATTAAKPKKAAEPKKAAASSGGAWELRAAQPGRAWVSRQGEREMKSVEAGDTLPGIGRVQRIDYANGRWIVVGTQGEIRQ